MYFIKKDAYGKYLSFATLGSYVAWLVAKVFKFPWRVIFSGFSAEGEQRPKLVSAHSQISLWFEKSVMMWNSTFCKIIFRFVIVIFRTVSRGLRQTYNCHSSFQKNIGPYSTSSHIHFVTNQEAQLWLLLVLWYVLLPHLFHTPKFPYGSHLYVGPFEIDTFCCESLEKWTEGKNHLS